MSYVDENGATIIEEADLAAPEGKFSELLNRVSRGATNTARQTSIETLAGEDGPQEAAAAAVAEKLAEEDVLTGDDPRAPEVGARYAFAVEDENGEVALGTEWSGETIAFLADGSRLAGAEVQRANAVGLVLTDEEGHVSDLEIGATGAASHRSRAAFGTHRRFDVRAFLPGWRDLPTGPASNAQPLLQKAMDAAAAWAATNARHVQLYVPSGDYRVLASVLPRTGVGIAGAGFGETVFRPVGTACFLDGSYPAAGFVYRDMRHEGYTVDGSDQIATAYTTQIKGIFIQEMEDCYFDVEILNTWATGLGIDNMRRVTIRGRYNFCGRQVAALNLNPEKVSGNAGIGIGTGSTAMEEILVEGVEARGNGTYGFFTEKQPTKAYFPCGVRVVGGLFTENWIGIKDAGSTGLIVDAAHIVLNKRAGYVLATTILNGVRGGVDGLVRASVIKWNGTAPTYTNDGTRPTIDVANRGATTTYAAAGVVLSDLPGGYGFDGVDVTDNFGPGYLAPATAKVGDGLSIRGGLVQGNAQSGALFLATQVIRWLSIEGVRLRNNGTDTTATYRDGITLAGPTYNASITGNAANDTRAANKTQQRGIALVGGVAAPGLVLQRNDVRDNAAAALILTHTGTDPVLTSPNIGA